MKYFSEDKDFVNAECEVCKKILKIRKTSCQFSADKFELNQPLKCFCGNISKVKDTRKIIIIVSILMLINGCYARMQQTLRDDRLKPINFNNDEKIAVMLTDDGSHTFVYGVSDDKANMTSQTEKTEFYLGSGIIVATKVQAALLGLFSQVEKFNTKNKEKAILLCKQQNVKFLVVPTILHWEDRNSPWSGIADKIEVKIELFDMTLDKMVNSIIFKANTEWATLTDKPPEDLLNGEFNKAIVDMFGSVK